MPVDVLTKALGLCQAYSSPPMYGNDQASCQVRGVLELKPATIREIPGDLEPVNSLRSRNKEKKESTLSGRTTSQ